MNPKKKYFIVFLLLIILILIFIYSLAKSYSTIVFNSISDKFIRFHVVANSNSTEDQILKYKIRDKIIDYISPYLKVAKSKNEAMQILKSHITEIYGVAYTTLNDENISYPITIELGKFNFPTRDYSDFILPEGVYDALRIKLGNANGQNWWCVMFPSICIPYSTANSYDNDTLSILKNTLGSEELSIVTKNSSTSDIKLKFKLVELFENM